MTRSTARELAVRLCFGISENPRSADEVLNEVFDPEYYTTLAAEDEAFTDSPGKTQMEYISRVVRGVGEHSAELDGYVEKYSKGWKFERVSRMALAIIKTAMFEILYMPDIPNVVSINEAVELAKRYEEPETVPFINGVLGSFTRGELPQ